MAKKTKKKLTTKQEQAKHRALQYAGIAGIAGSVLTPFGILAIVNHEEWFAHAEGYKVGIGFILAACVVGFAIALVTIKKEKQLTISDGWISLIVLWVAVACVFKLLAYIYNQIFDIMMWTAIGLAAAFGFDIFSKKQEAQANELKDARKKAKQELNQERAKEELKEEMKKEDKVEF